MININRTEQSPASLQTQAVKGYLDNVRAWRENPTLPKPDSNLPAYRNSDLIEAFDDCFFAKCYLTEKKFVSSYEMDIEHFLSKNFNEFPELRYEWTNLYPADHDANMVKPRITPEGGYLDPCHPDDDVENELFYWLDFGGRTCHFEAINKTNIKAVNTAELLNKIHNGNDAVSKLKTGGLRKALFDKRDEVNKAIISWLSAKSSGNKHLEMRQATLIKHLLSRQASFTMLIRSTSVVKQHIPEEFLD
jgi:hypothetical protein